MNVETQIVDAMQACGIVPPQCITFDGKIRRHGTNKSCWSVFFDGHVKAGAFGNWKTGVSEKFVEDRKDITPTDRKRIGQQMRDAATQRERELRADQARAAKVCADIWKNAGADGANTYLSGKGFPQPVSQFSLRQGIEPFDWYEPFDTDKPSLIVPVLNIDGAVSSLQFIAPDGEKRFYPGGKIQGCFCPVGFTFNPAKLLIAEGIATALTLFEDTGLPVISAFNANNLVPVAESIRWRYPRIGIVICGDDDFATEGNPGKKKAIEAAARCSGKWVLPDFSGLPRGAQDSDFNDLRSLREASHG